MTGVCPQSPNSDGPDDTAGVIEDAIVSGGRDLGRVPSGSGGMLRPGAGDHVRQAAPGYQTLRRGARGGYRRRV